MEHLDNAGVLHGQCAQRGVFRPLHFSANFGGERTCLTLKKKGSTLPVKFTTSMEGSIETEHLHIRSLNYSVDMQ